MILELFVYEGQGSRRVWGTLAMPPPYGWIVGWRKRPFVTLVVDGGGQEPVRCQCQCRLRSWLG
jgi:hypothetical protein